MGRGKRMLNQPLPPEVNIRAGLPHVLDKLRHGESVRIAFLGGSITEGAGASKADSTSYRALTGQYFCRRFPDTVFRFINAGVGGTNSALGAARMDEHVFAGGAVDLLFVEFSVNDSGNRQQAMRGIEGIIRKCRRLSPNANICLLYAASTENLASAIPPIIAAHEEVAQYYAIPSVNFAARLHAKFGSDEAAWAALAPDGVHPNDAGYAHYAQMLAEFLDIVLDEGALAGSPVYNAAEQHCVAPMDAMNYEFASMRDTRQLISSSGFAHHVGMPEPYMNWRFAAEHVAADCAGAELSFTASGSGAGLLLIVGMDAGMFEYAVNGKEPRLINPFDEWCLVAYRPVPVWLPFPDSPQEDAVVTIRIAEQKDARRSGNGLRIMRLMQY
ncbi:SGNH/GDSL hydrolase family protein [Paenibacillaceae bacterium]|nr:SGNH/GDSL hydrolase family protein [Paenibacillaceae bacterium]